MRESTKARARAKARTRARTRTRARASAKDRDRQRATQRATTQGQHEIVSAPAIEKQSERMQKNEHIVARMFDFH